MKKVWVKVVPWNKKLVTTAIEGGADAVLIPEGYSAKVKELGLITTVAVDGDLLLGQDVLEKEIRNKADENEAASLARSAKVIVRTTDWTVIPLENLVAQAQNIVAEVHSAEEARTALGILEKGVDTVLIATTDLAEVKRALKLVKEAAGEKVELAVARVTGVKPLGMGDRVCVDTCTNMGLGEGMLVGNSSAALFLIHAESVENPYVATRPFRVNAGPVHAYTRVPGGKTRYLSELAAGDEVLVVDWQGKSQVAAVGRTKVEKRPLMLITAEAAGKTIGTVVQNAETIRLTSPQGKALSVVKLKEGDEVLVVLEAAGRHFGMKVDETITEK